MCKVSIIIPFYNAEKFFKQCIESAINQTMSKSDYEIILVNNGSTDESKKIAEDYCSKNSNIILINQENRGPAGSINTGLRHSNGKYVYILHSDDMMRKKLLEICYDKCEENKLDAMHFGFKVVHSYDENFKNNIDFQDGQEVKFENLLSNQVITGKQMFGFCYWNGPEFTYFFNKEFLRRNNLYFDERIFIEDVEFFPRFFMKAERIMHINDLLYDYRISEINTCQEISIKMKYYNSMQIALYKLCDLIEENRDNNDVRLMDSFRHNFWSNFNSMKNWTNSLPHINKNMFINSLYNEFIRKYIKIFGREFDDFYSYEIIENMQYYKSIEIDETLYKLDKCIKDFFDCITRYKISILENIPFNDENKKIGIYGVGLHTKKMIDYYNDNLGPIRAKIEFIDTVKGNNCEEYSGCQIINVKNIKEHKLDCIVISSATFEDEINEILQKELSGEIKIYRFYEKSKQCIF